MKLFKTKNVHTELSGRLFCFNDFA